MAGLCQRCGGRFAKPSWASDSRWEKMRFCSRKCAATRRSMSDHELVELYVGGITEQANNRRDNVTLEYRGERRTLSQWARHVGLSTGTLHFRLKRGWPIERALWQPIRVAARKDIKGKANTARLYETPPALMLDKGK